MMPRESDYVRKRARIETELKEKNLVFFLQRRNNNKNDEDNKDNRTER